MDSITARFLPAHKLSALNPSIKHYFEGFEVQPGCFTFTHTPTSHLLEFPSLSDGRDTRTRLWTRGAASASLLPRAADGHFQTLRPAPRRGPSPRELRPPCGPEGPGLVRGEAGRRRKRRRKTQRHQKYQRPEENSNNTTTNKKALWAQNKQLQDNFVTSQASYPCPGAALRLPKLNNFLLKPPSPCVRACGPSARFLATVAERGTAGRYPGWASASPRLPCG